MASDKTPHFSFVEAGYDKNGWCLSRVGGDGVWRKKEEKMYFAGLKNYCQPGLGTLTFWMLMYSSAVGVHINAHKHLHSKNELDNFGNLPQKRKSKGYNSD